MFNLQGSELIIILLLALVVLGPEKLPDAMRKLGQLYAEIRKMSSGFQEEFRSVMDEPVREMRDTANLLRDSADFTKLQDGERDEKPKSADMPTGGDPEPAPTDEVPFREGDAADADASDGDTGPADVDVDADAGTGNGSDPTTDAAPRPRPFSGNQLSSAAPRSGPTVVPPPPAPFASSSDLVTDADDVDHPDAADATAETEVAAAGGASDDDGVTSAGSSADASSEQLDGVDDTSGVREAQGSDAPGDPTR